jgi:hypothetical protein
VKHRINSAVLNALIMLSGTLFFVLVAQAQTAQISAPRSPIHLEAAVVNAGNGVPRPAPAAPQRSAAPQKPRVKPQSTRPTAPALKLETREVARRVVREDQAARQQQSFMLLGSIERSDRKISPHVMQNLRETAAPPLIEMGDRPARSQSLCGDGKHRKFAELDSKAVAALLPEFNALRPRTVCARRGVLIADYAFK